MASLANALVSKILGHSAAEKAFRPWWDNFEDFFVYGLVMLGIIVGPTVMITGTPMHCNLCTQNNCIGKFSDQNFTQPFKENVPSADDPKFNNFWVKEYCTRTAVDKFILYFPYILLVMALVIVMVERVFVRLFKSGLKLDTFYGLLVKEILSGPNPSDEEGVEKGAEKKASNDLENAKSALEVAQTFQQSSSYFFGYLCRTIVELILALVLLVWLIWGGVPIIRKEEFIYCNVHGFAFECAGHPQQFYLYILFVAIAFLAGFLFCSVYNILWMLFPQLGTLSRVMREFRSEVRKNGEGLSDQELLGELNNVYFMNRDLKLLLDLLAESSGIATSIRILSLFDREFHAKCRPTDLKVTKIGNNRIIVSFGDAKVMTDIFVNLEAIICIYTVEILPSTIKSSVVAFKFNKEDYIKKKKMPFSLNSGKEKNGIELKTINERRMVRRTEFTDLNSETDYTIRVCTIVNGRTIANVLEKVSNDIVDENEIPASTDICGDHVDFIKGNI